MEPKIERKTTSIKVEPSLWKRAKKKCIDDDIDISEYIENLIKKDMINGNGHTK